jgi:hypothetical protein
MTRLLDLEHEVRETSRRDELVKALEFGLAGAIANQGAKLQGFAIKYGDFDCLMTIKADFDSGRMIAFVGSDTIMNCLLRSYHAAARNELRWKADQYHPSGS